MIRFWLSIVLAIAAVVMTAVLWIGDGGMIARIVVLIVLVGAIVSSVVAWRSKSEERSGGGRQG